MRPMVHYIPLRKDFSNFDEVVSLLRDPHVSRELVENAHRDLIASGEYSYASFVRGVDQELEAAGQDPAIAPAQRRQVDAALRRGRIRRRMRTEAHYLHIGARMVVGRRLPRARPFLGLPPEVFS